MITKFLKIIILIAFIITSSCGIKKRWEESGVYTNPQSQESTYIWKKVTPLKTEPVQLLLFFCNCWNSSEVGECFATHLHFACQTEVPRVT